MTNLEKFCINVEKEFNAAGIPCSLTLIKNSKNKSPKIIVSFCAFRIPDPYKDESLYINGLNLLFDNFSKVLPNAVMLLLYDDSVLLKDNKWKPIIEKGKTKDFVQMVKYDFPQYKIKDTFYHNGLFGTMLRFFPMFDFYNSDEITAIDDIDYKTLNSIKVIYQQEVFVKGINILKQSTDSLAVFGSYGVTMALAHPRLILNEINDKYGFSLRMLMRPTMCKKKLPKKILIDFFLCVYSKCDEYMRLAYNLNRDLQCDKQTMHTNSVNMCAEVKKMNTSSTGYYLFGIDEYFLNYHIVVYFLETKKKFIVRAPAHTGMNNFHFMFYLQFKKHILPIQFMKDMYKYVLNRQINTDNDVHKAFSEIDKIIYIDKSRPVNQPADKKKQLYFKIFSFIQSRKSEILNIKNLNAIEMYLINILKNLKKEDIFLGPQFYEVRYVKEKNYALTLIK